MIRKKVMRRKMKVGSWEWGVVRERRGVRERKGRGRRGRVVKVGE